MFIFTPYIFTASLWAFIFLSLCEKFDVRLSRYGTEGDNESLDFTMFFICVIGAGISHSLFHELYMAIFYMVFLNQDVLGAIFGLYIMALFVLTIVAITVSSMRKVYRFLVSLR
jgi:hypothetical protein